MMCAIHLYHFCTKLSSNNVPYTDITTFISHHDLLLVVILIIITHLIRMQHTTVYPPTRFHTVSTHICTNVPQFAITIVPCSIYPFTFPIKSNFIHRCFMCFSIRKLHKSIPFHQQTFVLCLSDSVSYNLNDFTEQAARKAPSGENDMEFTGYE